MAVLWVDAHPDVMTPKEFQHAHAMLMGNLLGEGDPDFRNAVKRPIRPANVMYAGVHGTSPMEAALIDRLGLRVAGPRELAQSSEPVLQWLRETGARHLAIHFDLDVLDPKFFRSLLFAEPGIAHDIYDGVAQGKMTMDQIVPLLGDASTQVDVVGLGIAEHLPWDALALKKHAGQTPLTRKPWPRLTTSKAACIREGSVVELGTFRFG